MLETLMTAMALANTGAVAPDTDEIVARALAECGEKDIESDITITDARGLKGADAILAKADPKRGWVNVLIGGDLSGEDMKDFEYFGYHGCFYETDLSNTTWHQPTLVSTKFVRVKLAGADLRGASFDSARFIGVDATGTNFSNAYLRGAVWIGAGWETKLEGANFSDADMSYFAFECGITVDMQCGGSSGANFSDVLLAEADLASFPIWGFDTFAGATLEDAYISARAIPYLQGVNIRKSVFLGHRPEGDDDGRPVVTLSPEEFATVQRASLEARSDVPSFDCAKASIEAERLICGEYQSELRRLDRDMDRLFGEVLFHRESSWAEQRAWLKQRNACEDTACIKAAYEERLDDLFAAIGTELALAPDATLQFEEDVVPVTAEVRTSPLYRKIVPAIRMASMASVKLTGREDGSISAFGEAVGGNAHTCSLYADELVYDPKTGWYSGQGEGDRMIPILRVWENRLFFRYSGNMADTPDEAVDFLSCGMRAGFSELRQLGK